MKKIRIRIILPIVFGLIILFFSILSKWIHFYFLFEYIIAIEYILGITSIFILSLLLFSIYKKYEIKDHIILNSKKNSEQKDKKTKQHYHSSYSNIIVFFITILGLLFSAYSDSFYQQSNPISPILNGLNNNETFFPIDNSRDNDTKHVIVVDVSGSINNSKDDFDDSLEEESVEFVNYFANSSTLKVKIDNLLKSRQTLDELKLKICYLLVTQRERLIMNNKNYIISLISFGKFADLNEQGFNLKEMDQFEKLINTILDLKYSNEQVSKTEIENVIKKINKFLKPDGIQDSYDRPKMVISIFSDFINDSETQIKEELVDLITDISNKSVFYNLFYIKSNKHLNQSSEIELLTIFNNILYPGQINEQNINDKIDLRYANINSSKNMVFIVKNPFYNKKRVTYIKMPKDTNVKMKLLENEKNDWQQFQKNGLPINFNKSFPIKDKDTISFFGQAPNLFSKTIVEVEFLNDNEKMNCEIVFQKGLPWYISIIFVLSGIIIIICSFIYLLFVIKESRFFAVFKKKLNECKNNTLLGLPPLTPPESVDNLTSTPLEYYLKKDNITGSYFIPCKFDNVELEASLKKENTISLPLIEELYKNGKLKDITNIEPLPYFHTKNNHLIKFNVLIFNSSKDNIPFAAVEGGISISISKELLLEMGFDDDISDGILKLKKTVSSE